MPAPVPVAAGDVAPGSQSGDVAAQAEEAEALRKQQYFDKLVVPTPEQIKNISEVQKKKELETRQKYRGEEEARGGSPVLDERLRAAGTIQRTYRGHRSRRQLQGLILDPSTRWIEAINEARYRQLNTPRQRKLSDTKTGNDGDSMKSGIRGSSEARRHWQQAAEIARRATHDEESSSSSSSDSVTGDLPASVDKAFQAHCKRQEKKEKEAMKGKMMDISYFLEMVDLKHRYGTNLRAYHAEWKKANTNENFFYWLDYGKGKHIELTTCPRERLNKEKVRYLSREERRNYLVDIDDQGKLRWHKNGELIDTTEAYRDSVEGIVPQADKAQPYHEAEILQLQEAVTEHDIQAEAMRRSSLLTSSTDSANDTDRTKRVVQVSPAVIFNRLLRKTMNQRKNSWLFVADTSMNLYVGIKHTGQFQHSSFLHGSRIAAAGLIKIKEGQLRSLSPLSGHYRPPTSAFKNFIASLKDEGVDMSQLSISKSYAVLVGLEAYAGCKKRAKSFGSKIKGGIDTIAHPREAHERRAKERARRDSEKFARGSVDHREVLGFPAQQRAATNGSKGTEGQTEDEEGTGKPQSRLDDCAVK